MRLLPVLGAGAGVLLAGWWLHFALASDEKRIEWAIDDMAEGYSDGDVGDCTEYLSEGWSHDQAPGIDRTYLADALRGTFLRDMQSRVGRRVEIDEGSLEITVSGDEAESVLTARFFRVPEGRDETLEWHARLRAAWHRGEDGWEVVRSGQENLAGSRPR